MPIRVNLVREKKSEKVQRGLEWELVISQNGVDFENVLMIECKIPFVTVECWHPLLCKIGVFHAVCHTISL